MQGVKNRARKGDRLHIRSLNTGPSDEGTELSCTTMARLLPRRIQELRFRTSVSYNKGLIRASLPPPSPHECPNPEWGNLKESSSKSGMNMVCPEPCKELSRRNSAAIHGWDCPYQPSSTRAFDCGSRSVDIWTTSRLQYSSLLSRILTPKKEVLQKECPLKSQAAQALC